MVLASLVNIVSEAKTGWPSSPRPETAAVPSLPLANSQN